jgi:hypothetical protein
MSLLSYFSLAGRYAVFGKKTQKADMAAQSVIEELDSCSTFDQIEKNFVTNGGVVTGGAVWTVDETQSSDTKTVMMKSPVTVESTQYQARVTLDYDYSTTDSSGDTTAAKYNSYEVPKIEEVYSENNVVLAEADQLSTAEIYYKGKVDASLEQIREKLTRTMHLDIAEDSEDSRLYRIKAYYVYRYEGKGDYEATIKETKIEKDQLQKIYLFYNPLRKDYSSETVNINVDSSVSLDETKNFALYFICQKWDSEVTSDTYKLDVEWSANSKKVPYYTEWDSGSEETRIVQHDTEKRIAKITVDIYSEGETDYSDDNRIVRLETSKGA